MPKGIVAPGKTLPPLVVPIKGLTSDAGSDCAASSEAEAMTAARNSGGATRIFTRVRPAAALRYGSHRGCWPRPLNCGDVRMVQMHGETTDHLLDSRRDRRLVAKSDEVDSDDTLVVHDADEGSREITNVICPKWEVTPF